MNYSTAINDFSTSSTSQGSRHATYLFLQDTKGETTVALMMHPVGAADTGVENIIEGVQQAILTEEMQYIKAASILNFVVVHIAKPFDVLTSARVYLSPLGFDIVKMECLTQDAKLSDFGYRH